MTNPYRAMCAEPLAQEAYVAFVQICKGGSDDAGTYDADEEIVRRALKRLDELESALLDTQRWWHLRLESTQAVWTESWITCSRYEL